MAGTGDNTTQQQTQQEPPEPQGNGAQTNGPGDAGAQGTPGAGADDGQLLDKRGEPAINKARYDRDIKAKDDRISELERLLEDVQRRRVGELAAQVPESLRESVTRAIAASLIRAD